jgi:hypothetical protein
MAGVMGHGIDADGNCTAACGSIGERGPHRGALKPVTRGDEGYRR